MKEYKVITAKPIRVNNNGISRIKYWEMELECGCTNTWVNTTGVKHPTKVILNHKEKAQGE